MGEDGNVLQQFQQPSLADLYDESTGGAGEYGGSGRPAGYDPCRSAETQTERSRSSSASRASACGELYELADYAMRVARVNCVHEEALGNGEVSWNWVDGG